MADHEKMRIRLQGAAVALLALGLLGGAGNWAVKALVAAEIKPLGERVVELEAAVERTERNIADLKAAMDDLKDAFGEQRAAIAEQSTNIEWIRERLQDAPWQQQ